MATVKIAGSLRRYTENSAELIVHGETVWDVLCCLADDYPSFGEKLFRKGMLNKLLIFQVDNKDIRFLDGVKTALENKSVIYIHAGLMGG